MRSRARSRHHSRAQPLSRRSAPRRVEHGRLEWYERAFRDLAVAGAVEAEGRPCVCDAAPFDGAVGERGESEWPQKHFTALHSEGAVRELAPTAHVSEDLGNASVRACDLVVA